MLCAARERRRPQALFHAAIELYVAGRRYVIEMTPASGQPAEAFGVIKHGPVGMKALGRLKLFRYEVRAWPDGVLPDRAYAVGSPVVIECEPQVATQLLASLFRVPELTWGRAVLGSGDMWNSNSLVAWLLVTVGVDASKYSPPAGGRAPGWRTGIAQAHAREN